MNWNIVPWQSLKTRVTLFTLAIFMIGIWSLFFYASRMLREDITRQLSEQQQSTAAVVATSINNELTLRLRALDEVAKILAPLIADTAALQTAFAEQTVLELLFNSGVVAIGRDGIAIGDLPRSAGRIGISYNGDEWIDEALRTGKSMIGRPTLGKKLGVPVFVMTVPIRDPQGMVIGALAGVVNLGDPNFLDKIGDGRYGKSGGYLLVAPQFRVIVTASDKRRVMETLPAPGIEAVIDRRVEGQDGTAVFINPRGVEVLSSSKRIPVAGWFLVVSLPTEEAFAPIGDMQQRMLLAAIVLTLLAGGLTWWMLSRQLSPMLATVKTLAALSETNLPTQYLPVASKDEIGELVGGFNRLLEILRRREVQLETERDFFSALLKQSSDGVLLFSPDGHAVREANPSLCKMLGYEHDELCAMKLGDLVDAPAETLDDNVRQAMQGVAYVIGERNCRRKDGSRITVEVNAAFVETDGGQLIMANLRDITERKRAQQALARESRRNQVFLRNASDGVHILDADGNVLEISDSFCEMLGYSREELIGANVSLWDAQWSPQQLKQLIAKQIAKAGSSILQTHHRRRDGSFVDVEVTGHGLELDGKPVLFNSARDITERKQGERLVRDSEKRFRAIFDQAPIAMALLDKQGHPIISNSPLSKMVGYSNDELSKMRFSEFTHPEDVERDLHQFNELIEGKISAYRMEKRYIHKNGNLVWANLFVTILRDENGLPQDVIGMAEDITERKRGEETRALRETELEESQRIARIGSWEWTRAAGVAAWSDGMNHILARDRASPAPSVEALPQFYTPESWAQLRAVSAKALETGASYDLELEMIRADGATCWTTTRGEAIRGADGTVVKLRGTVHDITERKEAEHRIVHLNRVYAVLSGINTLVVRVRDRDELFREACRVAVEEGGFRMSMIGIVDRSVMKLVPVASAGKDVELLTAIKNILSSSEAAPTTMAARAIREKKAVVANDSQNDPQVLFGKKYAESGVRSMVVLPLIVADEAVGVLALYSSEIDFFQEEELKLLTELVGDIAFAMDHIEKQERLNYLAYYDVLTGLANRSLFLERVAQYVRSAGSDGHKLALYLIDLERFKNINDSLGRPAGDALLRQVAQWLTHNAGGANLLARVGADHFAAVMPEVKQDGDVARLLEKWMEAFLGYPFRLNDAVFQIAAKVGVALFPDDGADVDTLFRNAESALKKAKASGDRYLFYTQRMTEAVAGTLTLENQLRQALDKEEFVLHYQPKVNLASGKLTGAEALIRWNDPRTGLVPPGRFIPILEETGLIYEVGRWALRKAIEDYLRWRATGLAAVRIAVNVSPLQLRNRGFIAEIRQAIDIDARAAAGLELEITESLIMEDVKHSIASLQAIRAMGVSIAIDDFGTGFSSLSYLAKLPVDTLKIDRSFVLDMTASAEGLALVQTIVNLAHSLKLKVVAEGVETEEQSRLLRLLNCDELQGFLFSKPVPGQIFEKRYLSPAPAA